jgi:hypothetical protein
MGASTLSTQTLVFLQGNSCSMWINLHGRQSQAAEQKRVQNKKRGMLMWTFEEVPHGSETHPLKGREGHMVKLCV